NVFSGLGAGVHTLKVKDANGCEVSLTSITITAPPALVAGTPSSTKVNVNCFGGNNGSIDLTVADATGGTGTKTYTYAWTKTGGGFAASTEDVTALTAGTYSVVVTATDVNGCVATTGLSVTITQPIAVTVSGVATDANCFGASNGSIAVTNSAGSSVVITNSSNAVVSNTGLPAGTYTLTATAPDGNNIGSCTATATVTINQPTILSATVTATNVTCFGGNGSIVVTSPSGGAGTYEYSNDNGANWQSSGAFTLVHGTYQMSIRDAANPTCIIDLDGTNGTIIMQPAVLSATATATHATCFGGTGSIAVTAPTGGAGTYEYSKDNGANWQSSGAFTLVHGTYQMSIRDAANPTCIIDLDGTTGTKITQPTSLPSATIGGTTAVCIGSATAPIITFTGTGGTGTLTYAYTIDGGSTQTTTASTITVSTATAGTFTYTLLGVTDANGCVVNYNTGNTSTVTVNALPTITTTPATICAGASVDLSTKVTGADAYVWKEGTTTLTNLVVSPSITTTYSVEGLNTTTSCKNTASLTVTVNPLPTSVLSGGGVICTGGTLPNVSIALTGTAPWSVTYTDGTTPVTVAGITTSPYVITTATAGTYTITAVSDANCTGTSMTGQATVTVNPLPTAVVSGGGTVCEGVTLPDVSIALTGTAPWSVTYTDGTTPTTVTATTSPYVITGATAGTYTVTAVSDANCTGTSMTGQATVTVNPKPAGASITLPAICSGTAVGYALTTSNSVNSTFSWVGASSSPFLSGFSTTAQTGSTITDNLTSIDISSITHNVIYTVTPTSVTGNCAGTPFTVTVPVKPPLFGSINVNTSSICIGGSASLNFSTPFYGSNTITVDYSDGSTTQTVTLNAGITLVNIAPTVTTTYTLVSMTVNGCTKTFTGTPPSVTVTVNPLPTLTVVNPAAVCSPATVDITTSAVQTTNTGTTTNYYSTNTLAMAGGAGDITTPTAISSTSTIYIRSESAGCYVIQPVTVTVNPLPTVVTTPVTICAGASTTLSATGANTYVWKEGTATLTNLTVSPTSTTTYTVEGTDANGCKNTASLVVTVNPLPTIVTTPVTICTGASTTLTATGANTYVWKEGTATLTNLTVSPTSTTTYIVEGTDANGCKNTASLVVTVNPLPTVVTTPVTICTGASTTLSATGANTYVWKEGTTTLTNLTVSPTSTTTYTVEGTDGNGCKNTALLVITVNPLPTFTTTSTNPSCNGVSNGTITVATSATSPMFSKNGGSYVAGTSPYTFTGLADGIYSIKIKDGNGCESSASSVTITQPAAVVVIATPTSVLCHGGNGSAALSATGGNGTYTFTSSGGTVSGSTLTAPAGTYTITATDGNNCTATVSVTITQPLAPLGLASASSTNVLCKGGATGTATVTVSGGTSPYTYAWTGANGFTGTGVTITGLLAGTYNVTIKDANNCTANGAVTVTEPTLATSITASSNTPVCEASALNLTSTATSSTGGLTYAWAGSNAFVAATQNANIATTTLAAAGTYTVTVTDGNSCVATATTAVVINPLPTVYNVTGNPSICSGVASPITLSGSTVGVNYKLTASGFGGSVLAGTGSALIFTPPANILGTYTIEATNTVTGCKSIMNGSITTVNATNPTLSVTSQTNVSCKGGNDGTVTVLASTGSGSYNYSFNAGTVQSSGTFAGNSAGTYAVVANDITTGCKASINVTITEPASLPSATVASSGIACVGNTITLTATATGGTAGYTYNWNGTGFVSSNTLAVTTSGINTLVVKDSKGCTSTETVSTTVTFNALPVPVIAGTTTLCSGSTLNLTANDGVTYAWSGPNSFTSTTATISIPNVQTVNAGVYSVMVTNANSCVASATANVIINLTPTASITPTSAILTCTNPSTALTASGGSTYSWTATNGFTANTAIANITSAGTYTVTASSSAGCISTASVTVTENKVAPTIVVTPTTAILTCANPTTSILASGADSYSWTSTGGFTASTATANINATGIYTVVGTSTANGCTASASVEITEDKATPTVTVTPSTAILTCTNPTTTLTASGGISYAWSGAGTFTTSTITASLAGTYNVMVTGANGCTATTSVVITEDKVAPIVGINPGNLNLTCSSPITSLMATGSATSFSWSGPNGFTSSNAILTLVSVAGTYSVIGTSTNGCTASASVEVMENKATPTITVLPTTAVLTCLNPTTTITASGSNTYQWTGPNAFISNSATANITVAGTYTVIGTNANGCTASASVEITEDKATPT
ncbi:SprB-like repeat protein, partial [Arcicella aurantiaca]